MFSIQALLQGAICQGHPAGVQTCPLLGHGLTFQATEGDAWPPLPVQAGAARQGAGDVQGFPQLNVSPY